MANEPKIKAISIRSFPTLYPILNIKGIRIMTTNMKPSIKCVKIQSDRVYADILYNGTMYAGVIK